MRIQRVDVYRVAMPLVYPFRTAYGNDDCIESILVRMEGDAGFGWGESTPWRAPGYSPEWAEAAFGLVSRWLAPQLVGREVDSGDALQKALSGFKGNYFAKAALDTAWWDLHARTLGQPLWRVIGGSSPTVSVGADFGVMESVEALLAEIDVAVRAGFGRVKLKFRPGWDLDIVASVRQAFPETAFHIDCNSAYRLEDRAMFRQLDAYNLAMIEQPLAHDDLLDHAALQAELNTPICLDESIISVDRARKAIATRACGWVNLKPGRLGGLTNAIAAHNLCAEAGIPCWVGGMLESAVGQAYNLALATLPNIHYPCDIFPSSRFYAPDLSEPEVILSGPGEMTASAEPGIGCAPNPSRLAAAVLDRATVR